MSDEYGILDLLVSRGFNAQCKAKLVRHEDRRFDLSTLIRDGWFELYQSTQKNHIFRDCDSIISLIGDGGTRAKFYGVYRVLSERRTKARDFPESSPFAALRDRELYYYDLERQKSFDELAGRVIVDWGQATRSWHQHLRNKKIIEIFPSGRVLRPFTDYLDFSLTHDELCSLFRNEAAHRDWRASLSSVTGIYLILAEKSGQQYIGSAYGLGGVWGRWKKYAANGHGNNKLLKQLVRNDPDYPNGFRYSLLQVLPRTTRDDEVIAWETRFKTKFGTRATGLNAN